MKRKPDLSGYDLMWKIPGGQYFSNVIERVRTRPDERYPSGVQYHAGVMWINCRKEELYETQEGALAGYMAARKKRLEQMAREIVRMAITEPKWKGTND